MHKKLTPVVLILLVLSTALPAFAQEPEIAPCPGEGVAGTVVGVEDQTVLIETEGGSLCTVLLQGEYDHPIVELLGNYFGDVNAESLAEALGALETTIACGDEGCDFAAEGDAARVVAVTDNGDGTWTIELMIEIEDGVEENKIITTDDADLAATYMEALESLTVEWELQEGEDGPTIVTTGDDIAAYHEEGYGFGVLVKVYAMVAAATESCAEETESLEEAESTCGAAVEDLIAALEEGTGLGQLFKEYGKPDMLGVGHVRQASEGNGNNGNGICNARANGGNANANGHNKDKNKDKNKNNGVECEIIIEETEADE